METFFSRGPKYTRYFAKVFYQRFLLRRRTKKSLVIALQGEMGTGKTTFIKALAKILGLKKRIVSPSFLIIKSFPLKKGCFKKLFHIDVYRLKKTSELTKLGFIEIIKEPKNLVLIEWAEKIKTLLPQDTIWLKFKLGKKENERIINY